MLAGEHMSSEYIGLSELERKVIVLSKAFFEEIC